MRPNNEVFDSLLGMHKIACVQHTRQHPLEFRAHLSDFMCRQGVVNAFWTNHNST